MAARRAGACAGVVGGLGERRLGKETGIDRDRSSASVKRA
jgi:hypothetical protein